MNIFDKRPLSLILCILLGGFALFSMSELPFRIALGCIGAFLLLFAIFVKLNSIIKRKLLIICSSTLLLSFLLSFLYFNCYFNIYAKYEDDIDIVGVVHNIESTNNGVAISIKTESINGNEGSYKLIAYFSEEDAKNISLGNTVRFQGELSDFKSTSDFNEKSYYVSAGYSARINNPKNLAIQEVESDIPLEYYITLYRKAVCARIVENSDSEGGGLLCALLFDERNYLSAQTNIDFKRTGLTHTLALSGANIAILTFAISKIFSKLGVSKKPRKIIEIIFTLLYVTFTGFPVSVVRAGYMVIISALLFLIARSSDSVTNLCISVFVICLVEPYAIFSIGLWLSAFATFGVLMYSEYTDMNTDTVVVKQNFIKRIMKNILAAILASFFAISATVLLTTLNFGTLSVVGFLTTPFFSLFLELFMYIGTVFAIVGNVLGLGSLIKWFGHFIIDGVGLVSSINSIYITADIPIVQILLFTFTLVFCLFAILNLKKKKGWIALMSVLMLSAFSISFTATKIAENTAALDYTIADTNERFLLKSEGKATLIDVSTLNITAAYETVNYIHDERLSELDKYVFTEYSDKLFEVTQVLCTNVLIREMYLPEPKTDAEKETAKMIEEYFQDDRIKLFFYGNDKFISAGSFSIFPHYRSSEKEKLAFLIFYNEEVYTYLSAGMLESDTKNVALPIINGCDTLILGRHGNSYYDLNFIYEIESIKSIIISSKNLTIPDEIEKFYEDTKIYSYPEVIKFIR